MWIGRPDGTPVPGQFGLASAAPLLLQVHDLLVNRDRQRGVVPPPQEVPASIGVAAICWPLGQALARDDPNCRRQRFAWTLDGTVPPTLQAVDQPLGLGLSQRVWLDAHGRQVAASCEGARERQIALWPAPLEPWLPRRERRAARLPAASAECPPALPLPAAPLSIVGVREGDRLRRPASSAGPLQLKLSALGGSGTRWWFLNGMPVAESQPGESIEQKLTASGLYQLSLLDQSGATARVEFQLGD